MARETREERAARIEREKQEALDRDLSECKEGMMALLEAASKESFDIAVKNGCFSVLDRNEGNVYLIKPEPTCQADVWYYGRLESAVSMARMNREEAERLTKVRREALAKLTKEERDVLGL